MQFETSEQMYAYIKTVYGLTVTPLGDNDVEFCTYSRSLWAKDDEIKVNSNPAFFNYTKGSIEQYTRHPRHKNLFNVREILTCGDAKIVVSELAWGTCLEWAFKHKEFIKPEQWEKLRTLTLTVVGELNAITGYQPPENFSVWIVPEQECLPVKRFAIENEFTAIGMINGMRWEEPSSVNYIRVAKSGCRYDKELLDLTPVHKFFDSIKQ